MSHVRASQALLLSVLLLTSLLSVPTLLHAQGETTGGPVWRMVEVVPDPDKRSATTKQMWDNEDLGGRFTQTFSADKYTEAWTAYGGAPPRTLTNEFAATLEFEAPPMVIRPDSVFERTISAYAGGAKWDFNLYKVGGKYGCDRNGPTPELTRVTRGGAPLETRIENFWVGREENPREDAHRATATFRWDMEKYFGTTNPTGIKEFEITQIRTAGGTCAVYKYRLDTSGVAEPQKLSLGVSVTLRSRVYAPRERLRGDVNVGVKGLTAKQSVMVSALVMPERLSMLDVLGGTDPDDDALTRWTQGNSDAQPSEFAGRILEYCKPVEQFVTPTATGFVLALEDDLGISAPGANGEYRVYILARIPGQAKAYARASFRVTDNPKRVEITALTVQPPSPAPRSIAKITAQLRVGGVPPGTAADALGASVEGEIRSMEPPRQEGGPVPSLSLEKRRPRLQINGDTATGDESWLVAIRDAGRYSIQVTASVPGYGTDQAVEVFSVSLLPPAPLPEAPKTAEGGANAGGPSPADSGILPLPLMQIVLGIRDGKLVVVSAPEGGDAALMGIKPGTPCPTIDGKDTAGLSLAQVRDLLRKGNEAHVTVEFVVGEDGGRVKVLMPGMD